MESEEAERVVGCRGRGVVEHDPGFRQDPAQPGEIRALSAGERSATRRGVNRWRAAAHLQRALGLLVVRIQICVADRPGVVCRGIGMRLEVRGMESLATPGPEVGVAAQGPRLGAGGRIVRVS